MAPDVTRYTVTACHKWLLDFDFDNNTGIQDVNDAFVLRNIGGIILIGILTIFGMIGNSLVLWIYWTKFRRSNYRTYIVWLASLDIVNCTLVMPFYFTYLCFPMMMESTYVCKSGRAGSYVITLSSAFLLIVIAGDRYRNICFPNHTQLPSRHAHVCCFLGLVMATILSWPTFVLFGTTSQDIGINNLRAYRCLVEEEYSNSNYMTVFQVSMSVIALAVTITLTVLYSLIVKGLHSHKKYFIGVQGSVKSRVACAFSKQLLDRSTRKSTLTLLAITLSYILSALPHHVLAIAFFMNKTFECSLGFSGGVAYYTFVWMVFFNTAVHPLIYGFSDTRFQFELRRMCLRVRRDHYRFASRRSEWSTRSKGSPRTPTSTSKRVHFSFSDHIQH